MERKQQYDRSTRGKALNHEKNIDQLIQKRHRLAQNYFKAVITFLKV